MKSSPRVAGLLALALVLTFQSVVAKTFKNPFKWEEVTSSDWAVGQDSAKRIFDAAMLFEKVSADDEEMVEDKCYRTVYRRIRILNERGRNRANVSVPFVHPEQRVIGLVARAIHPDGTVIDLQEEHIFEKEIVITREFKYKQTSFSIPGVTDDCIIEYMISIRIPYAHNRWPIQKDIPLLDFEYQWLVGQGVSRRDLDYYRSHPGRSLPGPNYLWFNSQSKQKVDKLPSNEDTREVRFSTSDVPPFEEEPYGLPSGHLRDKLICFYGATRKPALYWGSWASSNERRAAGFCEKSDVMKEVVAGFGELDSDSTKINTAYDWILDNITNTTHAGLYDEKDVKKEKRLTPKRHSSVDEMIERGYGSRDDIHLLFWAMLHEMNIEAKIAYAMERTHDLFVYKAKYWQFSHSAVMVLDSSGAQTFYTPGIGCTPASHVPWYLEGVQALTCAYSEYFVTIPFSSPEVHRSMRSGVFEFTEDYEVTGRIANRRWGQFAQATRADLFERPPEDHHETMVERIEIDYGTVELDSVAVDGLDRLDRPVTLTFSASFPSAAPVGDQWLLKPLEYFTTSKNPFVQPSREGDMMFQHAHQRTEAAEFAVPAGWVVDAVPSDTVFVNQVGLCAVQFSFSGDKLMVQRSFTLDRPYWPVVAYEAVRELYQARQDQADLMVILTKRSD